MPPGASPQAESMNTASTKSTSWLRSPAPAVCQLSPEPLCPAALLTVPLPSDVAVGTFESFLVSAS